MTKLDMLLDQAGTQFYLLQKTLTEIEHYGMRPQVLLYPNGMPQTLRIDPAHPTTPQVDKIRAEKVA